MVEKCLFSLHSIIKICFAGCGFVTVVIYLKNISLVGSFVLGVCVYSVLLWISGVITIDDLKGYFFTEMMRRGERGIDV